MLRLPKCCRPVLGDPIVGYISLGKGSTTIQRDHRANAEALQRKPGAIRPGGVGRRHLGAVRVELQIVGWDRMRLLEDLLRTLVETGINHPGGPLHGGAPAGQ